MALHEFSQEDLLGKKYNELLKISKTFGIKTSKRLKTEKLIEAILKCQQEEVFVSLSQDAAAVASALDGATHTHQDTEAATTTLDGATHSQHTPQDELLLDVQFPDCGPRDLLNCHSDSPTDTSLLEDTVTGKEKVAVSASAGQCQTHKRSGTYEVEEMDAESWGNEGRKLQRSSTFDLSTSNDTILPIDEKTDENSKQMSVLMEKITMCRTRRNTLAQHTHNAQGTVGDSQPTNKEGLSRSCKRRRSQTEPTSKESVPSSFRRSRLSISSSAKRRRQSVVVTPSAPAPPLRSSSLQRQSCSTPSKTPALINFTTTTTSSTTNALFTIGCGNKKDAVEGVQNGKPGTQDKAASAIPRFMSYARRLKVPNFARIHEQAFQRMDSLDDYVGKRRARHDTLGSTTKKKQQDKAEVFQPSVTSVKNLNFNFTGESAAEVHDETKASQTVIKHRTAPSHSQPRDTMIKSSKKSVNTPQDARVSRRITQEVKPANVFTSSAKKSVARKSPRLSCKPPLNSAHKISPRQALKTPLNLGKECQNQKQSHEMSPKTEDNTLPTTGRKLRTGDRPKASPRLTKKIPTVTFPAFGSHLKENCCPGPNEADSPASVRKRMQDYSKSVAASARSYVPYKGGVKPMKQRDNLKNLAQRKHNVKSSKEIREGQKNILKGVRLNKRFELQMANRGIKL
ncbi:uncharacterized protein LOC123510607 isoform X1 [Portunus trituberculatus]|uniref:uncharacterized protein LOC123510607 isoform X1 n=1 Tax=Portunus trituberculatus TaxID=210409 RepID=UPI001E1CF7C1|nr:uncharacterized protein LOC123510607 isoform X1 [Portunus trituberculatus]